MKNALALAKLVEASSSLTSDFSCESAEVLAPYVQDALREAAGCTAYPESPGASLRTLVANFGWSTRSGAFSRPLDPRIFSARLKAFLFEGLRPQGSGSYAVVYRARHKLTGQSVTLKKLRLDKDDQQGVPSNALREASLLRELSGSPHIVRLLDVLWDLERMYLVMETLDHDLRHHLDTFPSASDPHTVKSFMYQLLKGVAHAHAHRIVHRDIKPANILVDAEAGCIKLADFGLARTIVLPARPYTHEVVTLLYRAPEILLGSPIYSTPVDMWSCGCVLAEMVTGEPLFQGDSEIGQLYAIFQALGTPDEGCWPGVSSLPDWQPKFPQWHRCHLAEVVPGLDPLGLQLLGQLLEFDPGKRPRARQALAHPWFDDIRAAEEARSAAQRAVQQAAQQATRRALLAPLQAQGSAVLQFQARRGPAALPLQAPLQAQLQTQGSSVLPPGVPGAVPAQIVARCGAPGVAASTRPLVENQPPAIAAAGAL